MKGIMDNNKRKGFGSMDPERLRAIASRGGKTAQMGNAHRFNSDEAREAGKKGGRKVASIPGHMAEIGRKGGIRRRKGLDVVTPRDNKIS